MFTGGISSFLSLTRSCFHTEQGCDGKLAHVKNTRWVNLSRITLNERGSRSDQPPGLPLIWGVPATKWCSVNSAPLTKGLLALTALPRDIPPTSTSRAMPGHVEGKGSPALITGAEHPSQDGQRIPRSRASPAEGPPSPGLVPSAVPFPPFLPMLCSGIPQNGPSLAGRPAPRYCHGPVNRSTAV